MENDACSQSLRIKIRQLESTAALTGGLAHDYNNLLTVIIGNISLARQEIGEKSKINRFLDEALEASKVAKTLTDRLITFSMGNEDKKESVDISTLIKTVTGFSLSGSNIKCRFKISRDLRTVDVDNTLGYAFHHIIVNAAESMPRGGILRVWAENLQLDGSALSLKKGNYVKISFIDNGMGIKKENMDKIFIPYFSTKKNNGQGKGLGLSIADSIVTNHNGKITVTSNVGKGSEFAVFIPSSEKPVSHVNPEDQPLFNQLRFKKGGRILVMDDEAMVRDIAGNILKHLGYKVGFAKTGEEAITLYQSTLNTGKAYDLVILDLTIRGGLGGDETIKRLKQIDPEIKAIVSSGYRESPIMWEYSKYGFCGAIEKPYEIQRFSRVLSDAMKSV